MKIFSSKDVHDQYRGVSFTRQEVDCTGGAAVEPCKNFFSADESIQRFLPDQDVPRTKVQGKIDWAISAAQLFTRATQDGISEEAAESAIWPGTRQFYRGPQWLLQEAAAIDASTVPAPLMLNGGDGQDSRFFTCHSFFVFDDVGHGFDAGGTLYAPPCEGCVPFFDNGYHGGYYWALPGATREAFDGEGHEQVLQDIGWEECDPDGKFRAIMARPADGEDRQTRTKYWSVGPGELS